MKARKNNSPSASPAARLTNTHHSYLAVAGTNIEDLDRALKSGGWRTTSGQDKKKPEPA